VQREVVGLLLITLGAAALLGLSSITHGAWIDGLTSVLRLVFGLGAWIVALMFPTAGILLLQRNLLERGTLPWEKVVGFEVLFLAGLGLLHLAVPGDDPLSLARAGSGGGYVGWAISNTLAQTLGYEICTLILTLAVLWALIALSPMSVSEVAVETRSAAMRALDWARRHLPEPKQVLEPVRRAATPKVRPRPASPPGIKADAPIAAPPTRAVKATAAASEPAAKARREGRLPALDILDKASPRTFEEGEVRRKAKIIEETLDGFGLPAKVVEINRGPAVTQYGVEPGLIERKVRNGEASYSRVRVSKITSLVNDIALALAASPIRIEAPVPGRSVVGIEVPNDEIAVVSLRTIMESDEFVKTKAPLKIALGQDVSGQPVVADLGKMPHLLIAGATGSGKSVCINSIVSGLLFNNSPEQLKLLLIDPKMVELTAYNGIPHLLADVIIELDQVVAALTWITRIMEERYKLFSQSRARNIDDYNGRAGRKTGEEILPYIVVVIDELADLMMGAPVEVEWAICRLAQMARATGIHLVLATQRPSVDVVTGLIKANFPARISFQVTSQVDSRVMLDVNGAETLLGRGDMLFMAPDAARLQRIQGCFVSDREINQLVEFWRSTVGPEEQVTLKLRPWADITTREERDELLDQAIELVRKNGRASASLLQRRLRIGYPRAARLIDQLEEEGVIGPPEDGSRYRQVSDSEPERWDAQLDRELDAEFTEDVLQKGKGANRGVS
jgi:DNA segregation ATPase FtsK/SpoIIIE, S-DNA-T family